MKPITLDEVMKERRIDLINDGDFEAFALATEFSKNDVKNAKAYLGGCVIPKIIGTIIGMTAVYVLARPYTWVSAVINILMIFALWIVQYDTIANASREIRVLKYKYKITVFFVNHELNVRKYCNIYLTEDGFYDTTYNSIMDKIFRSVDAIYNPKAKEDPLSDLNDILQED